MRKLSELIKFLGQRMSMRDVYQPAIILHLLKCNGTASKRELAKILSGFDESVQEYYEKIVMRWPKITLTKHDIVSYDRKTQLFLLNFELKNSSEVEIAKQLCEEKIRSWIEQNFSSESSNIDASKRFRILKAARGQCELCGISSKISPIDIDHIVPRSTADRHGYVIKNDIRMHLDDERNLQALCFRCNRAKRDQDSTDFRLSKQKLVRDKIPQIISEAGEMPIFDSLSGEQFKSRLLEKLTEEHAELIANVCIDEIADMIEVLFAIAKFEGHTEQEILNYLYKKRLERGSFNSGIFLKNVLKTES